MANTRSITRKLKKDDFAPWSNLDHDLLFLIMMHLGFFDFFAFSGVCKSWRSLAISNWNKFMVAKQPLYLSISSRLDNKACYLADYNRRKLKTKIPHSDGRACVGVTCGYLIFIGRTTQDFWLVNPFTRKELHFPGFPSCIPHIPKYLRGILVFSPSMSGWVFMVITHQFYSRIAYSLAGEKPAWFYVPSSLYTRDLHFFKGKIYTICKGSQLYELTLHPEPTLTLLKMKNFAWAMPNFKKLEFVSSSDNLYVMVKLSQDVLEAFEVDFGEMKWVKPERTIGEYAVFVSNFFKGDACIKPDTWVHPWMQYEGLNYSDDEHKYRKRWREFLSMTIWYFPHDCLIDTDSDTENGALAKYTLEE